MLAKKIGIDLGTSRVRIHVKGEGIVVDEPSIVAVDAGRARMVAFGHHAADMAARSPESVEIVHPLREGVITDLAATEALLRHFVDKVQGRQRIFKPEVMISVASGVGTLERRDLTEAAISAGARQAWLIDQPLAAALGAGLDIAQRKGHAVCDIGAGTTEVAVLAESGTVVGRSIRCGGDRMDGAIAAYLQRSRNLIVDEHVAEQIKISGGDAAELGLAGMDVNGLRLTAGEFAEAVDECLRLIAGAVRDVIGETPRRLAADVERGGIVLTGGGAQLRGIDRYVSTHTGISARVAGEPQTSVVRGAGLALESFEVLKRDHSYVR